MTEKCRHNVCTQMKCGAWVCMECHQDPVIIDLDQYEVYTQAIKCEIVRAAQVIEGAERDRAARAASKMVQ